MMNTNTDISTPLVRAFAYAWAAIQKNHPEVPDVVITLGAGRKREGLVLGHFAPNRWARGEAHVHELFVGGEGLNRTPQEVMGTLLHEAAHGLAVATGKDDVSRGGRYHNSTFKALGEQLGVSLEYSKSIGWSTTTITPDAEKRYAAAIRRLEGAMVAFRREPSQGVLVGGGLPIGGIPMPGTKGRGRSSQNNGVVLECACEPKPRKIRVSQSVAEMGAIRCELCGARFE
jgi:hypothetical protein